jgi:hypothetical protein
MVRSKECVVNAFSWLFYRVGGLFLFTETEVFYELLVAAYVLFVQVSQQPPSLADKLEQAALCVGIMTMHRHVPGQLVYPLGQDGYLNLSGTVVTIVLLELVDDVRLLLLFQMFLSFLYQQSIT